VYSGFDSSASKYASYAYENNQPVFTAEQGTRFYLKLSLTANPWPTSYDLYRNGRALQRAVGVGQATINLNPDSVNFQRVQSTDAANYTITSSNSMGQGQFSFRLKVVGKVLYHHCILFPYIYICFSFPLQLRMHIDSDAPLTSATSATTISVNVKLLLAR
jgi:hypothetical protein